jgi:hypothetical protein
MYFSDILFCARLDDAKFKEIKGSNIISLFFKFFLNFVIDSL